MRAHAVAQVPLDGEIVWGEADVSAEHITGEALPARRRPGDELPAGARVHDGVLAVRATRPASQSTLARIARLTRQAKVRANGPRLLVGVSASPPWLPPAHAW